MNNQNIMLGKSNLEIDTVPKNYLKLYLSGIKIVIAEKKKEGELLLPLWRLQA